MIVFILSKIMLFAYLRLNCIKTRAKRLYISSKREKDRQRDTKKELKREISCGKYNIKLGI